MEHSEGSEARKGIWNKIGGEPKESEGQSRKFTHFSRPIVIYLRNMVKFRGTQPSYLL